MGDANTSLASDLQELISKSMEANRTFMNEGTRIMKQFTLSGNQQNAYELNTNLITDAFNAYAKLNIQHMKNMLDLSISLLKQAGSPRSVPATETEAEATPSFTLTAEAQAGTIAYLSFVLDNIKTEDVTCTLINTPYYLQGNETSVANFDTVFTPQSFNLATNQKQKVVIEVSIPASISEGIYKCSVQVKGFEPAYFNVFITVKASTKI